MTTINPEARPTDEVFVETWAIASMQGWTLERLAKRLNLTAASALNYSRKLAASGVKLPLLSGQSRRPASQIRKLNKIVEAALRQGAR
jgi:hypothetical protein